MQEWHIVGVAFSSDYFAKRLDWGICSHERYFLSDAIIRLFGPISPETELRFGGDPTGSAGLLERNAYVKASSSLKLRELFPFFRFIE